MIYKKVEIKVEGYQETADLYTYILDNSVEMRPNRKRPVIVICTGGCIFGKRKGINKMNIIRKIDT